MKALIVYRLGSPVLKSADIRLCEADFHQYQQRNKTAFNITLVPTHLVNSLRFALTESKFVFGLLQTLQFTSRKSSLADDLVTLPTTLEVIYNNNFYRGTQKNVKFSFTGSVIGSCQFDQAAE